jgi:hypothetical protein
MLLLLYIHTYSRKILIHIFLLKTATIGIPWIRTCSGGEFDDHYATMPGQLLKCCLCRNDLSVAKSNFLNFCFCRYDSSPSDRHQEGRTLVILESAEKIAKVVIFVLTSRTEKNEEKVPQNSNTKI